MNIKNYILIASLACVCSSCELLQPNEIINPNVDEDTFLKTPNAMSTWVNGANRSFATIIGSYVELTEILSRSEERRVGKECRSRWSPYH